MAARKPKPLPETLRHLRPFANRLAKLSPEDFNEDMDLAPLEAALRRRIRGMDEESAEAALEHDRALLEAFLKEEAPEDHPAYAILGALSFSGLASYLGRPPVPPPLGPEITFDAPQGWKVQDAPFKRIVRKGKVFAEITVIEEGSIPRWKLHFEGVPSIPHLRGGAFLEADFSAGPVSGRRYEYKEVRPDFFDKSVDYLLKVPGGFVHVAMGCFGVDFDEGPIESRLHTLRLSERGAGA